MNKKGLVWKYLINGIVVFIVVIFIVSAIYYGIFGKAVGLTKAGLPGTETFKAKLKELTTSEGEVDFDVQKEEAYKIYTAIQKSVKNMENWNDCVEKLDFGDVIDKDFNVEFKAKGGGTEIKIYKMGRQKEFIFTENFRESVFFTRSDVVEGIKSTREFILFDGFKKIKFLDMEQVIKQILYKGNAITFLSDDALLDAHFHMINKQICSTGKYLIPEINVDKIEELKEITIYDSPYTEGKNLDHPFRMYLGTFKREKGKWSKGELKDKSDIYIMKIVNDARDIGFGIDFK